jgi:phosphatidylglycerophosphate synthase
VSLFFSNTLSFKAWSTTLILLLAVFQLYSALRMWGKVNRPQTMPSWWGDAHRLSGTLAFAFSLPVAFHCLWALGFEPDFTQLRRFAHSVLGCVFYGAFAAKVTLVRAHAGPSWALPVVGGLVFTSLVTLWLTSSLWFFTNVAFPGI